MNSSLMASCKMHPETVTGGEDAVNPLIWQQCCDAPISSGRLIILGGERKQKTMAEIESAPWGFRACSCCWVCQRAEGRERKPRCRDKRVGTLMYDKHIRGSASSFMKEMGREFSVASAATLFVYPSSSLIFPLSRILSGTFLQFDSRSWIFFFIS